MILLPHNFFAQGLRSALFDSRITGIGIWLGRPVPGGVEELFGLAKPMSRNARA